MNDPRIIECAKMARAGFYSRDGDADADPNTWDKVHPDSQESWMLAARACTLKWLEQEPTPAMISYPLNPDPTAREVRACLYRLACDAAKKEIVRTPQTKGEREP